MWPELGYRRATVTQLGFPPTTSRQDPRPQSPARDVRVAATAQLAGNAVADGRRRSSGDDGGGDICGYATTGQGIGRGQFGKTEFELRHRLIEAR